MTYQDLVNGTEIEHIAHTVGIRRSKQLTKTMSRPYTLRDSVDGPKMIVVFDEHFIERFLQAESNECLAKMSQREKELLWDYVVFQDAGLATLMDLPDTASTEEIDSATDTLYRENREYNTPTKVVKALSEYTTGEVLELDINSCFNTNHIWNN